MRIIFFGSDGLGIPSLNRILPSGHELLGVVTIPDQKKGRGRKLTVSPVKEWAVAKGVPVLDLADVNHADSLSKLKELKPDLFIVASFGTILSDDFLGIPSKMCLNIHPSLLPKYRGASPVVQTLLNGDAEAGTTIMQIATELDSGDILLQKKITLTGHEGLTELSAKLSDLSADLMMEVIDQMERNSACPTPQNHSSATYCGKIKKTDAVLDWQEKAFVLHNKVRALSVWPGVRACFRGKEVKILQTAWDDDSGNHEAGLVDEVDAQKGIAVQTGSGRLWIQRIQPAGGKPMDIASFLNGCPVKPGEIATAPSK
ncbi:MAG: methionyl-tRNA formyltransferase [Candidatus Omnitrophica bacterium]|nr:methionyl-tRNA formyltransferase [Candidatus Omnitrophota bacterium]